MAMDKNTTKLPKASKPETSKSETSKPETSKPTEKKRSFISVTKFIWFRIMWPVLRQLIIPAICILVLFTGMAAGYVVLGDGNYSDIWKWETWRHMFDLIFAD